MPTFKEATDLLCLTGPELADIFGRSAQHIRQSRLDPDHVNYRPPPDDWQPVLAKLARERGGELVELAEELEGVKR